jgi:predicted flap endonuclease-1-like 5' DNA nuclease
MAKLVEIEGIGEVYAQKLTAAGVKTLAALLKNGSTPDGRKELAAKSGIGDALILEWVNHADLFRIKGIGSEYSDLLEEAGVDTVVELSKRNADNLTAKIAEINTQKKLVRRVPSLKQVTRWIEEAKALPRGVFY